MDNEKLGQIILDQIACDNEPEPEKLGAAVRKMYAKDNDGTDELLISLCGWCYDSLEQGDYL